MLFCLKNWFRVIAVPVSNCETTGTSLASFAPAAASVSLGYIEWANGSA
jgi:hypothetical protein